ncbi:putative histidine kinase HHK11p [Ophiobolus disseminans]|uniref:Putative histidine kinase HHK11p n=1 Tax=Ophiobolus disseminans TaxID=1469910 RepID=A0A6A7AIX9_9PLEO|nr:putative histidine kinase HHK11p [Ophiobolus disseminans]
MSGPDGQATPEQQHYHLALSHEHTRRTIRTIPELKRESSREELAAIPLCNVLDVDDRPSFAIDLAFLKSDADTDAPLDLVYCNAAFANAIGLSARVSGQPDANNAFIEHGLPQIAFRRWLRGILDEHDFARRGSAYMFDGLIWTAVTIDTYKIVSGLHASLLWPDVAPLKNHDYHMESPIHGRPPTLPPTALPHDTTVEQTVRPSPTTHGPFDLTFPYPPDSILSDHVKYFRSIDWAKTPLGSIDAWPPELRNIVNMCLNDINPCVLFWGDNVTMVYNEAYIQLIGAMHPAAMGKSARQVASHYWPIFQPLVDRINATGKSVCDNEMPIFIDRQGFVEETYWSYQLLPVLDKHGRVAGYYHPLFETTRHNLLRRRVSSLVELGSQTAKARTLQSYWDLALHILTLNDKDVPLALLYAAERQSYSDAGSLSSPGSIPAKERYSLKGTIGLDSDHCLAPPAFTLHEGLYVLEPFLAQAVKSRKATVVHLDELGLSEADLKSIRWQGFGDPCRTIVVCPLSPTTSEQVECFLILGTNPRRPFDDEYRQFVHVMLRLLATSLASVVLFDEEVRQKEKAIGQAAELQEQLLAEIQMREKRFQRFVERSDVAIFIMDAAGNYTYRNHRWYDLFEVAAGVEEVMGAWQNIAFPEDIAKCEAIFGKLVMEKVPVTFELKTKMAWHPPKEILQPEGNTVQHFRWILCSAYPEVSPDGELIEIVGNVTDISKQKWAEDIQKIRTDVALESKLHLEHFIDTTSHEMRNPLSAILQSADGILSSYTPDLVIPPSPYAWSNFLEQTLDGAQTIAQCAQHMRHIVDDILTISKLDSGLLVITPVDAQPEIIVKHAVKMFDAEAKAAKVDLSCIIDQSYQDMDVDWVSLDPTRLLQILINLLTNAIKFTRLEATRSVTVVLSASTTEPQSTPGGVQFNEEKLVGQDHHLEDDWKQDENLLFIQFSVTDTGRGLSEEERSLLFTRFSQASPRTHIHYGGSGLGLFISRRLTELQGGAIGLASESKKGSTFSFYIKTRRIKPAMLRKGSVPSILPEDIRHRPETPLVNMSRPPPPIRIPSYRIDEGRGSTPPSPRLLRQTPFPRRPSMAQSETPPEIQKPLQPDVQQAKSETNISDKMHVLVVEDNLVNQKVLAKQLRNLGCVVNVANHGREALDFLERTIYWNRDYPHPDSTSPSTRDDSPTTPLELSVVLMDWEMPIMNGLDAVAEIRKQERNGMLKGRVPVIGVTANVRQQQIETALAAGMDDVVGKPFRVAELLVRMEGIVKGMVDNS